MDINIGISSCLLGNQVRYDGQHKYDHFIVKTLGEFVKYVPVCPEVECGLSVPREAMRLVGDPEMPRLVTIKTGIDHTEKLKSWATEKLEKLAEEKLCGFIFKSKSPTSGMERIKIYPEKGGMAQKNGRGMFASMVMDRFPFLPVEDDGRLHDPVLRENFIERVFAYARWKDMIENNNSPRGLIEFHTVHKLIMMSHCPDDYRKAGKIVAALNPDNLAQKQKEYLPVLMNAMKRKSTLNKNFNVLQHILGYFKNELSTSEKNEALEVMNNYKEGLYPLIVAVTLMNHYVNKYDQKYLKEQYYLNPHPKELKLRNHS